MRCKASYTVGAADSAACGAVKYHGGQNAIRCVKWPATPLSEHGKHFRAACAAANGRQDVHKLPVRLQGRGDLLVELGRKWTCENKQCTSFGRKAHLSKYLCELHAAAHTGPPAGGLKCKAAACAGAYTIPQSARARSLQELPGAFMMHALTRRPALLCSGGFHAALHQQCDGQHEGLTGRGMPPLCHRRQLVEVPSQHQLQPAEGGLARPHMPRNRLKCVQQLTVYHGHLCACMRLHESRLPSRPAMPYVQMTSARRLRSVDRRTAVRQVPLWRYTRSGPPCLVYDERGRAPPPLRRVWTGGQPLQVADAALGTPDAGCAQQQHACIVPDRLCSTSGRPKGTTGTQKKST